MPTTNKQDWFSEILNCVNRTKGKKFKLKDIYKEEKRLKLKHTKNNNIRAKIRQQLQLLRNRGIIDFLGDGEYRKK